MSVAKEVVRAIIAVVMGTMMFYFWGNLRPDDPEYFKFLATAIALIMTFVLLHFIGKENN